VKTIPLTVTEKINLIAWKMQIYFIIGTIRQLWSI